MIARPVVLVLAGLGWACGFGWACGAQAGEAAYRVCVGKVGASDAALARCGDERIKRANAALDEAFKSVLGDMPAETSKKALMEEQAAWTAFREKSCLMFSSGDFSRDIEVVSFAVCRAGIIESRVKYLTGLMDN
ncbi:MAG: lysozyme inhibitor LprI family protein [Rhodoblastus sp.]